MFTGIVEGIGLLKDLQKSGDIWVLRLKIPSELKPFEPGESLSVDGCCLTVIEEREDEVILEVSAETFYRTKIRRYSPGTKVNLERALQIGKRLGGHFVTGHVDGVGEVLSLEYEEKTAKLSILAPSELSRYLVEKGSIAVDGVSLTINGVDGSVFWITLVPFTLKHTTLGQLRSGDWVNLEVDILAKYVEKLLKFKGIDEEFLKEHGFL
jgi:riboflavin synthase